MSPEQELDLRMADPGEGLLELQIVFPNSPVTYTYAAIQIKGLWYLTGVDTGGRSWDALVSWLKTKNAEVTSLRQATAWEDLL